MKYLKRFNESVDQIDTNKVIYSNKTPIGKRIYHIRLNDLLSNDFLNKTSLTNKSNFQENLSKRVKEQKRICSLLGCEIDFNKPTIQIEVSSEFVLLEILKKYLPHLLK